MSRFSLQSHSSFEHLLTHFSNLWTKSHCGTFHLVEKNALEKHI
jgi:hypothetical protein